MTGKATNKTVQKAGKKKKIEKFNSENLISAMEKLDMSSKALSAETHINYRTIRYYCNGERVPTNRDTIDLSQALNVSEDYILGKSKHPEGGLSAFMNDLSDRLYDKYKTTFALLKDMGIDISIEGDHPAVKMDKKEFLIDNNMLLFLLDSIRNNARTVFETYYGSSVMINGVKQLTDMGQDYEISLDGSAGASQKPSKTKKTTTGKR